MKQKASENTIAIGESATHYFTALNKTPTVESILDLVSQLRITEKLQLMESLLVMVRSEVIEPDEPRSLYGLWKGVSISEEDIAEARREMWGNFPRDDIFALPDEN